MSRVGKKPVAIPQGVTVEFASSAMVVKGPKGELRQALKPGVTVSVENGQASVTRANDEKQTRALHGLYRALLQNMVVGVTQGYHRSLRIVGTGYKVEHKGDTLVVTAGYCHPVNFKIPAGIEIEVPKVTSRESMEFIVRGIDKYLVGEVAAQLRRIRKPDLYQGKGIRYSDEKVRKLEGKSFGAGGK